MNSVALKIKRLRVANGITQEQMAEKVHLSLKAWQNIENGVTKLDLDRLKQISDILEITVVDLINSEDGYYIHQVNENNGNIYTKEVTVNNLVSDEERQLYTKALADKDKEIEFLRGLLKDKLEK